MLFFGEYTVEVRSSNLLSPKPYLKACKKITCRLFFLPHRDDNIFSVGHRKWYGGMLKVWAQRAFKLYGDELPTEIRNHFSLACADISPHWARHTGATMLLNAGAGLDAVGDILGHRDRKTTMRYAKIQPRTKRNTIAMMPSMEPNPLL